MEKDRWDTRTIPAMEGYDLAEAAEAYSNASDALNGAKRRLAAQQELVEGAEAEVRYQTKRLELAEAVLRTRATEK